MLNDLLSKVYEIRARQEATRREGLDLSFNRMESNSRTLPLVVQKVAELIPRQANDEGYASTLGGISIEVREYVPDNMVLLRDGKRLEGWWDLRDGKWYQVQALPPHSPWTLDPPMFKP